MKDALKKGDVEQAQKVAQKLADKVNSGKMSKEDMEKLKKELNQMQQKLNQANQKNPQPPKEMKDLAKSMKACQQCNNPKQLGNKLNQMKNQLGQMQPDDQLKKDLEQNKKALQNMRNNLAKNNPAGNPGKAGAKREFAEEKKVKFKEKYHDTPFNTKGEFQIVGYGKNGGKKGASKIQVDAVPDELGNTVQQKVQQSIDRQRIPQDTAETLRKFYDKLSQPK